MTKEYSTPPPWGRTGGGYKKKRKTNWPCASYDIIDI